MKLLIALTQEYPDNWMQDNDGMFGINPNAFETHHDFDGTENPETKAATIIHNLFATNPRAKIRNVTITFSPKLAEHSFGGTITISGVF